ncbi:glycosyltransferase family 4 protein, partial [Candidatus Kaiserbacteria bacterium]|nr:glycosyltransferase family 4 protein [Candidatus Kaiserbacteria bacterium]
LTYLTRFYRFFWRYYIRADVGYVFYHMGAIYNILAAPFFCIRALKKTKFYWWKAHGHINIWGRVASWFTDRIYTSTASGFPISTPRRQVIGQAIDTVVFTDTESHRDTSALLCVGRVQPVKHIELAIQLVGEYAKEGVVYHLNIVGPLVDATYHTALQKKAKALSVTERVTFIGGKNQTELVHEYQSTCILLNPSQTNSMDKVVLEAMACGVIPITSNVAFQELLEPFGLFCAHTVAAYRAVVERVCALSEQERRQLSQKLRATIVENHSLTTLPARIFGVG